MLKKRVIPTKLYPKLVLREAVRLGIQLLEGVGGSDTLRQWGDVCIHVRRPLSPAEIAQLSAAWRRIPAIDLAGGGPVITDADLL